MEKQTSETIGQRVKQRRKHLGLTLQQVCDRMTVDFDTGNLSRVENGKQRLTVESLPSLAEALEMTVNGLYGMPESRKPSSIDMAVAGITDKDGFSVVPSLTLDVETSWQDIEQVIAPLSEENQIDLIRVMLEDLAPPARVEIARIALAGVLRDE